MRVKICGLCRPEDAAAAARAGADFAGVVLAPGGRRVQSEERAARIFESGGGLRRVGVFAGQAAADVIAVARRLQLAVVQLHGAESPEFAQEVRAGVGCEVWKTVWLQDATDIARAADRYGTSVSGLLLDALHDGQRGGTGQVFDWALAAGARRLLPEHVTLIAAGGLTPANVQNAVRTLAPDVVDVASGVETVLCEKSHAAMAAFVRNAKQ